MLILCKSISEGEIGWELVAAVCPGRTGGAVLEILTGGRDRWQSFWEERLGCDFWATEFTYQGHCFYSE